LASGTKVVICHNCAGFGYTLGPVMLAVCGDDEATGMPTSRASDRRPEAPDRETLAYECGACSGVGYLTV
jgi:hypothetical protein